MLVTWGPLLTSLVTRLPSPRWQRVPLYRITWRTTDNSTTDTRFYVVRPRAYIHRRSKEFLLSMGRRVRGLHARLSVSLMCYKGRESLGSKRKRMIFVV